MDSYLLTPSDPRWLDTLATLRHDFYQHPAYVALEASRQQAIAEALLIQERDRQLLIPYVRRRCHDDLGDEHTTPKTWDIVSPYGYGGILISPNADDDFLQAAMATALEVWADHNVCSAFLRLHPLLNADFLERYPTPHGTLHSETIAVDLTQTQEDIWRQTRPEHRNKINKCKRAGFVAAIALVQERLSDFIRIYRETMDRVGALEFYYFSDDYFQELATALSDLFFLAIVEREGEVACAGLFSACCGIIQYHLGGTHAAFLKQSPSVLMFDQVRVWGKENGNQVLHLGGGLGGKQDSLHHFKAGFSKQRCPFQMLKLIPQQATYDHLVNLRAKTLKTSPEVLHHAAFFPAYRAAI